MSLETIVFIFLSVLIGLVGYLHYTINEQKKEIRALWLQISVVAAATAREFIKMQENKEENGNK